MKIQFRQTGGFAGLTKTVSIDSSDLPAEEAQSLQALIDQWELFDLSPTEQKPMPDSEQYVITVEETDRSRTMSIGGTDIPEKIKALVKYLAKQAKYDKR